jgi:hypothetical protein
MKSMKKIKNCLYCGSKDFFKRFHYKKPPKGQILFDKSGKKLLVNDLGLFLKEHLLISKKN